MSQPFLLGITGGIGSGKSVVCKILNTLQIPTYDADSRAKELMATSESLKQQIISTFGSDSYSEGQLNRAFLAQKVFNDPVELKKLNALVHPAVGQDFALWVKQNQGYPIVGKEAALLFETGSYKQLHKTILVTAPEALRIERVLQRDPQRDEKQVKAIIEKQWPEAKKKALADKILYNDEQQLLIPQVLAIVEQIKEA